MVRLEDLIGKPIDIGIVSSHEAFYTVTLHGVVSGGLWIEGAPINDLLGHKPDHEGREYRPPTKPVVFVPYAQIALVVTSAIELDEDALRGS